MAAVITAVYRTARLPSGSAVAADGSRQIEKIQGAFWTPRPGLVEVLQALVLFTASLPLPGVWFVIALVLSLYILVIVSLELVRMKGKGKMFSS